MRRWPDKPGPRTCLERKIVWAEGQIRATRGVIWTSGAPNDFSRSYDTPISPIHFPDEAKLEQGLTEIPTIGLIMRILKWAVLDLNQ